MKLFGKRAGGQGAGATGGSGDVDDVLNTVLTAMKRASEAEAGGARDPREISEKVSRLAARIARAEGGQADSDVARVPEAAPASGPDGAATATARGAQPQSVGAVGEGWAPDGKGSIVRHSGPVGHDAERAERGAGLVSARTIDAAARSFADVAREIRARERMLPLRGDMPVTSNSVEELLVHMLRPMVSEWLNLSLPVIVRDMVNSELSRIRARSHSMVADDESSEPR